MSAARQYPSGPRGQVMAAADAHCAALLRWFDHLGLEPSLKLLNMARQTLPLAVISQRIKKCPKIQ